MTAWLWAMVGVGGFVALAVVITFGVAAILGRIGRDLSELLLEPNSWASAEPSSMPRRHENRSTRDQLEEERLAAGLRGLTKD